MLPSSEAMADGVAFYKAFSNITTVKTDEGCVLIDTGSFNTKANAKSCCPGMVSRSSARTDHESSTMAKGIFGAAARESEGRLTPEKPA